MHKPSLLPLLRAHDEQVSRAVMPVGVRNRITLRLAHEAANRRGRTGVMRFVPMATFAAGAALVMLVMGWNLTRGASEPAAPAPAPAVASLAGYTVQGAECRPRQEGDEALLSGECRLVGPQLAVQTWDDVRLKPGPRRVVLSSGQATFDVQTVQPDEETVRVVVSHGVIEVLGTRFTVDQDEGGGFVDLYEGHIRFHPGDEGSGQAWVDIQPGQRHAWGDRAEPDDALEIVIEDEPMETHDDEIEISVEDEAVASKAKRQD
ncbi:MAG: FecR domain-containing protein, partial [Myxococcota bacterium]